MKRTIKWLLVIAVISVISWDVMCFARTSDLFGDAISKAVNNAVEQAREPGQTRVSFGNEEYVLGNSRSDLALDTYILPGKKIYNSPKKIDIIYKPLMSGTTVSGMLAGEKESLKNYRGIDATIDGNVIYYEVPDTGSYARPSFIIKRYTSKATITFTYQDTAEAFKQTKASSKFPGWVYEMKAWIVPQAVY